VKLRSGAEGQNRTVDTSLFRAVLYQLSYLGTMIYRGVRPEETMVFVLPPRYPAPPLLAKEKPCGTLSAYYQDAGPEFHTFILGSREATRRIHRLDQHEAASSSPDTSSEAIAATQLSSTSVQSAPWVAEFLGTQEDEDLVVLL
jgi:hypothetical protein